jgi:glycerol-3-phosphate dehydrogenase
MTDFGQGASSNSLKIVHGGLRYLQDGSLPLVRQMSRERRAWIRIAPHLVKPLPFLMPTTKKFTRGRFVMKMALLLNDLLSFDRNKGMKSSQFLPNGHIISSQSTQDKLPGLRDESITGGAVWHDAQILNSERLLLSVLEAAVANGAHVANYVEAVDFLQDNSRIKGIKATDKLTGKEFTIRADIVVNSAGALADSLLSRLGIRTKAPNFPLSTATNIITRQLFSDHALALPGQDGQIRFIVPWRNYSLIGTIHETLPKYASKNKLVEKNIQTLINDVNFAYPDANLQRDDVVHVHLGFLPTQCDERKPDEVQLLRKSQIKDHEIEDGLPGLISVIGVKYTTARKTAEEVVDLIYRKLPSSFVPSKTSKTPVKGGNIDNFAQFLAAARAGKPIWLSDESLLHLVQTYGSNYLDILSYRSKNPILGRTVSSTSPVLLAEVIHAVRVEMAQTLGDVIQRRTTLGEGGLPDEAIILRCADIMAGELKWTPEKRFQEIQAVYNTFDQSPPEMVQKSNVIPMNTNGHYQNVFSPMLMPLGS